MTTINYSLENVFLKNKEKGDRISGPGVKQQALLLAQVTPFISVTLEAFVSASCGEGLAELLAVAASSGTF